jgi:HPt (histidine-containing phosphotransfer) domain-containing protein
MRDPTHHADLGDSAAEAIDSAFLARQSLGDAALERDLLILFDRRMAELPGLIAAATSAGTRADIIHGLRGSALAVGAHRVARTAARYESAVRLGEGDGTLAAAHREMVEAVDAVRREIARRCHGS